MSEENEEKEEWTGFFFFAKKRIRHGRIMDIDILWKRVIGVAAILIFLGFFMLPSMQTVSAGYVGVRLRFGEVVGAESEGFKFVPWFFGESMVHMNIQIQKAVKTESAGSIDMQEVSTEMAVNYKLDPNRVIEIYKSLRQDYEYRVIDPNMDESLKATTAQFTANELLQKRSSVKHEFLTILQERLEPFGIMVLAVSLTDFQFDPEFQNAVEAANTAKQKAIEALNYLEQVKAEAQQQVIKAEANYNATVIDADAAAYAKIAEKQAEAEGIRLVVEQISANPEYLEYIRALQWDGKLPYFYGSDAPLPFIFMNSTQPGD